jgi:hypothetical protein
MRRVRYRPATCVYLPTTRPPLPPLAPLQGRLGRDLSIQARRGRGGNHIVFEIVEVVEQEEDVETWMHCYARCMVRW